MFKRLGLRDFARIDGWFLPSSHLSSSKEVFGVADYGTIVFTDINLVRRVKFCPPNISNVCILHLTIDTTFQYELDKWDGAN